MSDTPKTTEDDGCCGGGVGSVPYPLCTDCPRTSSVVPAFDPDPNDIVGQTVLVSARPDYRAIVERDDWGKLIVRPLPDQGITLRARAVSRKNIKRIEA